MDRIKESPQSPRRVTSRRAFIRTLALTLFGFVSAVSVNSPDFAQEPQAVKVERKPKFISNGPGQERFDVTRHIVPLSEIQRSLPKDAIPALVHPRFVTPSEVGKQLDVEDRLLGVYLNGEAKAYPIRILNLHELVNDEVGGQPILVSW